MHAGGTAPVGAHGVPGVSLLAGESPWIRLQSFHGSSDGAGDKRSGAWLVNAGQSGSIRTLARRETHSGLTNTKLRFVGGTEVV